MSVFNKKKTRKLEAGGGGGGISRGACNWMYFFRYQVDRPMTKWGRGGGGTYTLNFVVFQ